MLKDEHWLPLAGITLAHVGLLGALLIAASHNQPLVTPPVMMGELLAPPAPVQPPRPLPAAPQPRRPAAPAKPAPISLPLPKTAPSERAVTVPQAPQVRQEPAAREESVAAPAPVAAAAQSSAPAAAPVIPPRSDASHLNNPPPAYPVLSRRLSEQGRVLVDVYILPDGRVGEIKLRQSSGYPLLDSAALDAVRRWRYVPARRGNDAIPFWYIQPMIFSLDN